MHSIDALVAEFASLLRRRLGPERVTPAAQLVKLADELDELREDPADLGEVADIVIVATMMAHLHGHSWSDIEAAVVAKLGVNLKRDWFPTASGTARHTPEVDRWCDPPEIVSP